MSDDPKEPGSPAEEVPVGGGWTVDARGALGVQSGRDNNQYNYFRESSTRSRARPPLARDSPYLGLDAFSEAEERIFFGRDEAASKVLGRMSGLLNGLGQSSWSELLVVSGVSGSGKSSLLAAGVLTQIRDDELAPGSASWPYLIFTPTAAPLDELAKQMAPKARVDPAEILRNLTDDPVSFAHTARQVALAPPNNPGPTLGSTEPASRRLVLVVDQFEQLFTQCQVPEQRRNFITALSAAASGQDGGPRPGAFVVLVVRADFEAQCADYPELKKAVQDRYLLTSMTERQLRLAIAEPAKQLGASVDSDLVEHLLQVMLSSAAASSPDGARHPAVSGAGSLPLLSHALNQAWCARTGQTVTLADYQRTGGIEGAVEKSAQQAYDSLSPSRQAVAQRVFTRLVATSDGRDTADRVSQADLKDGGNPAEAEDVDAVLRTFADKRLLTLDAGTVQISHDVLLTAWPRLSGWLDETRDSRKARARLRTAVAEWKGNSRHRSYLWQLDTAADTEDKIRKNPHYGPLSQDEDDFLRASIQAQHRRVRVRQMVAALLTVLALLTTSLAAVTVYRGIQLARQLAAANADTLGRESQARAPADIATAAQLALAGWRSDPKNPQARAALANAYLALQSVDTEVATLPQAPRRGILVRGDTALLFTDPLVAFTGVSGPTPRRWDIPGTSTDLITGDLSPDGRWFAWVAKDGTVRVCDLLARSEPRIVATGLRPDNVFLVFSPEGQRLASLAGDGHGRSQLRIWDLATGALVPNGVGSRLGTDVFGFWLTPDPREVLVRHGPPIAGDTRLVLHSLVDGSELATMPPLSVVARAGAAVVSCGNRPSADGEWTYLATSIGNATPPVRFSGLGTCFSQGLSVDGNWLVDRVVSGSATLPPGGYTLLRLTDLRNGQSWQVSVPSFERGAGCCTVVYPLSTLGVSTAAGRPEVLLAHGASLLRLRAEPYLNDQGQPPSRQLADGGRFLSMPISGLLDGDGPTTLTVQDRATGRPIATIPGLDHSVIPTLQGNSLWLAYQAQQHWQFDRYEVSPLHKVSTFVPPDPEQSEPHLDAVFVGRPASMLITVSGGVLSALDPTTGRPLARPVTLTPPGVDDGMGFDNSGRLAARPAHPGQVAVWGERDVQIWDALGGRKVATIPIVAAGNYSMAFDPSGRRIALLTREKTIEVWDVDTVRQLHQPIPSADANALVGFDADGYLDFLTDSRDRLVFLDLDQGQESGSMDSVHGYPRAASIVGDPVVPVDSLDEIPPYELPVTAQTWHDKLCAVADRPFTPAELAILPPGTDTDPPCS